MSDVPSKRPSPHPLRDAEQRRIVKWNCEPSSSICLSQSYCVVSPFCHAIYASTWWVQATTSDKNACHCSGCCMGFSESIYSCFNLKPALAFASCKALSRAVAYLMCVYEFYSTTYEESGLRAELYQSQHLQEQGPRRRLDSLSFTVTARIMELQCHPTRAQQRGQKGPSYPWKLGPD